MSNLKKANDWLLKVVGMLPDINTKANQQFYKDRLLPLSEAEIMERLFTPFSDGKFYFPIYVPNNHPKYKINQSKMKELGEKLGVKWFQHLTLNDPVSGELFTTPNTYLVMPSIHRRQIQNLVDKIGFGEDDHVVDTSTGQVTGASKGASMTFPEINIVAGKGLIEPLIEAIKLRGGDDKANLAMREQVRATGNFNMRSITALNTRPQSVVSLKWWLLQGGIDNNADSPFNRDESARPEQSEGEINV